MYGRPVYPAGAGAPSTVADTEARIAAGKKAFEG